MAILTTTTTSSPWSISISQSGTLELQTQEKYLDRKIQVFVPAAAFNYIETSSSQDDSKVPLVTTAGYSSINWITQINMPAGTSSKYRALKVNQANSYTDLYSINNNSANGRIFIQGDRNRVEIASSKNLNNTITNMYLGSAENAIGNINSLYVGYTNSHEDACRGYIGNLFLRGKNTSTTTSNHDAINVLKIGNLDADTNTYYRNARINTLYNYGTISKLLLDGGTITNLYGTGTIGTLGSSSSTCTLNITKNGYSATYTGTISINTNTNGTVNIWPNGGAADKGVTVTGHVVTVDGGTVVTSTAGDLITTSLGDVTGGGLTSSGTTLSSTNNSGVSVTRAAATCKVSTAGWVVANSSKSLSASTQYINGVTISAPSSGERTFSITVPNGSSSSNVTFTFHIKSDYNVYVD